MLTELQKKTAQAIVNIFETGTVRGEYGRVTLLANDPGRLTYGRSQTTLTSGNLYLLIKSYCEKAGALYAEEFASFLEPLAERDTGLDHHPRFRSLLGRAGEDQVMREVQDSFFDRVYWSPAEREADLRGLHHPLEMTVVYDSFIHGSWHRMRDRTVEEYGSVGDIGPERWIEKYVEVRKHWLAGHSNTLLHKTVYRMDALNGLIKEGNWELTLPVSVHGVLITKPLLLAGCIPRADSAEEQWRFLRLKAPYLEGEDVENLQESLKKLGIDVIVDGIYGPATEKAVRQIQRKMALKADGIVGPATRSALGIYN